MNTTKNQTHLLIYLLLHCLQAAHAESAKINIKFVQNDALSPTLLTSEIIVKDDQVIIKSSGIIDWTLLTEINPTLIENEQDLLSKKIKFENSIITLKNKELSSDLIHIIKHFELCHPGSNMEPVSGGTITEINCHIEGFKDIKKAYYLFQDSSKRRANTMHSICRLLQKLIISNQLKEIKSEAKAFETLKTRTRNLVQNISKYTEAFNILEKSYQSKTAVNWEKTDALSSLRPNQAPREKRKRLVKETHSILSAFCSKSGLHKTLTDKLPNTDGLLLTTENVRRCYGSFNHSESMAGNIEWGFDDESESLGFIYPPTNPAAHIAIIDNGLHRLLLHFLLQESHAAPTTYEKFRLTHKDKQWLIVPKELNWAEPNISDTTKQRLAFLTKNGLLNYLFKGKIPTNPIHIKIDRIYIENDQWDTARIDYSIGSKSWVAPFFMNDNKWQTYRPWPDDSYFHIEGNRNSHQYFRSRKELDIPRK